MHIDKLKQIYLEHKSMYINLNAKSGGGMKNNKKIFDYIICGAGSAGCCVASRLSENPSYNILLLEAGPIFEPHHFPKVLADADIIGGNEKYTYDYGDGVIGGKTLGGSSSINACAALRARKSDFDQWDQNIWSWDEIVKTYIRLENSNMYHKSKKLHNDKGPFPINQETTDSISPSCSAFIQSAINSIKLEFIDDFNGEKQYGVGTYPRNIINGTRQNVSEAYLTKEIRERTNLTIKGNSFIEQLLFDDDHRSVIGVIVKKHKQHKQYFASKEVILSAGAYGSPLILIKSGIGPKQELEKLGIPVIVNLPIGKQLFDHPIFYCMYEFKKGITDDGPLLGALAWIRSSKIKKDILDMQIIAFSKGDGIGIGIGLTKPKSIGHLTFERAHRKIKPVIQSNFLKDPNDKSRLLEGIGLAHKIAHTKPLSDLINFETSDPDQSNINNIKNNLEHFQHGSGTIPMGEILDWCGAVKEIKNLRVIDASIIPYVISTPINLTVIMMAERITTHLLKSLHES